MHSELGLPHSRNSQIFLKSVRDEFSNRGSARSAGICSHLKVNCKAIKKFAPIQPGDVVETISSTESLKEWTGFYPKTSLKKGIRIFANWYKDYYF